MNRGALVTSGARAAAAHAAPARAAPGRRRPGRGRAHRPPVRRGPRPRRGVEHDAALGLRHEAGVARRPRPGDRASSGATTTTRRRAARLAAAVGVAHPRRLPCRRDDELAGRGPRGAARRADRRARRCTRAATACRSSTCARRRSGGAATSRAPSTCPTTTSTRCRTGIDPGRPIAVICASGQRSAVGASLLQMLRRARGLARRGRRRAAWERSGYPVEHVLGAQAQPKREWPCSDG